MDCKSFGSEGDFEAAVDILRKKGQKVAAKRADRDATEGAVIAKTNGADKGVILKLSCETDFVAKNEDRCFGAQIGISLWLLVLLLQRN